MKKEKTRSLFLHLLLFPLLFGCSMVYGQSLQETLLGYLEQPFTPKSDSLTAATYQDLADVAQTLLNDSSFQKEEKLLVLLAEKAIEGDLDNQQTFLQWAFTELSEQSQGFATALLQQSKKFPKAAFTPSIQFQLVSYLQTQPNHLDKWVLLTGFATQEESIIRALLQQQSGRSLQQAGRLALTRMGVKFYREAFLKNIKKIPVKDEFIYNIVPLAIYTHDPSIIDYLVQLVINDQGQCQAADAEIAGRISCGYRLVEALSTVILNFPIPITEDGDWEVADYPTALADARKWLKKNRRKIELRTTSY